MRDENEGILEFEANLNAVLRLSEPQALLAEIRPRAGAEVLKPLSVRPFFALDLQIMAALQRLPWYLLDEEQ